MFLQVSSDWFGAAEAGSRRAEERYNEGPLRVGAVDIREEFLGDPAATGERGVVERFATASRGGVDGNQFVPGYQVMDSTRGHLAEPSRSLPSFASWRMWNLDSGHELEGIQFTPNLPGVPAFTLAPDDATYRLEQVDEYPVAPPLGVGEHFRTGPATTTWTFTSHPSDVEVPVGYRCPHPVIDQSLYACQIQPLIQLEYELGLDINNRAPAGRAHTFTILAGHHSKAVDRAKVTDLTVQASFDDGETWTEARVVGKPKDSFDTGGFLPSSAPYQEFLAVLDIPRLADTNGFVTLRVQAADANGGTVDQTIQRAYILKP
jgi:hypothetical protein